MKKSILGILIIMESLFLGLTTIVSLAYGEEDWYKYLVVALSAATFGTVCKRIGERDGDHHMTRADSFLVVVMSWILFSVIGMVPYVWICGMDAASAFFETMSGFTTTGATCFSDIDAQPRALLLWRSVTQWIGGLGIVVFSFALIPVYELKNSNVYSAEVTGLGVDKLRPKIGATARRMLMAYLLLTTACAMFYWIGPMDFYDSVCHALTTIATGGFSTHTASMAHFHSAYIEYVACAFMIFSSINFSLYYYLSIRRVGVMVRNEELRTFFGIVFVSVAVFTALFFLACPSDIPSDTLPHGAEETFRTSLFHVSTIISSTGFAAQKCDYVAWGPTFWMPTLVIMAIGACAGGTAGGIKVIRIIIAVKSVLNELIVQLHPRAVLGVRVSGQIVPADKVRKTLAFIVIYVFLVTLAMLLYRLIGEDADTALGSSISMLSNTGPGMGTTGPTGNFSSVPTAGKYMLSLYMLIGRLEIFTVLFLLLPQYWKDRK